MMWSSPLAKAAFEVGAMGYKPGSKQGEEPLSPVRFLFHLLLALEHQ